MLEVEGFRVDRQHMPDLNRIVIAVDPATKSHENADLTACTVAGRGIPPATTYGTIGPRLRPARRAEAPHTDRSDAPLRSTTRTKPTAWSSRQTTEATTCQLYWNR